MRPLFSLFVYKTKTKSIWYARFHDQEREEVYKKAEQILSELSIDRTSRFIPFLESFWSENNDYVKTKKLIKSLYQIIYV